jgi:aminopeptidase N
MSKQVRRLFRQFRPETYQLEIAIDPEAMRFHGSAVITGKKVGRPNQRLVFHQKGLKITTAKIVKHDKKGDTEIALKRINHHNSFDEVRLHTDTLLYAGPYSVILGFDGPIQDSMHGMYVCNYEVAGKKQKMIATQFESHYAREAFPCIDEPEAKATFALTLVSPKGEVALSNTPVVKQVEKSGKLATSFEPTPKMSTYLLAFACGKLHSKTATTKHGVETRVWATKAHKPEALDFALDVAKRALEFFNDYYGVPYPLAKCDHIALPDFSAGAMENWGLITYRESCLIIDPASDSQSGRERIALVMAHELSHQWFGDLVTMKWWDDLWLNESFANVMEYVGVNALFPDWNIWNDFIASEGLSAIRRDCTAGVQSVNTTVKHPDEISSMFDPSIVYAKGGRLLNMLMRYVGEVDFRTGLKQYFTRHAYGNTSGSDLWQAIGDVSGKDIAAFMNPWLQRSGFPLIEVMQNGAQLKLHQSHFLLDASKADPTRLWPVPLLADDRNVPELFAVADLSVKLASDHFVQLNRGAIGHYVVRYTEPEHARALAKLVETKKLTEAERLMLLHDSSLLARADRQSFAETLELLQHYRAEDSEPVWDILALIIADCRRFVDIERSLETPVKGLVRKLITAQYARLGWKEKSNESSHDTKLRATIIGLGVYAEYPDILAEALKRFEQYKTNPEKVPNELRSIVFGAAVRQQAKGAFDYLLDLIEHSNDVHIKDDITSALTVTQSHEAANSLLARLKDADKVRAQDVDFWLVYLLRNRHTREVTWNWLRNNWDWIEKTFAGDQTYDNYPRYVAGAFSTPESLAEYKAFFEPKQTQTALARNITLGIEEIANRAAWLQRDLASMQTFFGLKKLSR